MENKLTANEKKQIIMNQIKLSVRELSEIDKNSEKSNQMIKYIDHLVDSLK